MKKAMMRIAGFCMVAGAIGLALAMAVFGYKPSLAVALALGVASFAGLKLVASAEAEDGFGRPMAKVMADEEISRRLAKRRKDLIDHVG